ncbi:MAG: cytidine deaminase [Bacteroidales bacterium]|nr:cytidine deaminase [Bacteroidales bacterium]MDD4684272.1 cytidine deaminase [Bacteroidales bacterium]
MEKKTVVINYFQSKIAELSEEAKNLVLEAQKAIKTAYSPYSEFSVGSALLLDNGQYVRGSNQENAAYPSGLCGERVALFAWGANNSENKVVAIAITAQNKEGKFAAAYPCGACLQVMVETEIRINEKLKIIVQINEKEVQVFNGVECLIPFSFTL